MQSGLLAAGDKILEVNGIDISSVDHQKAVEIFLSTGDNSVVRMKVIKNAYKDIQLKKDQEQEVVKNFLSHHFTTILAERFNEKKVDSLCRRPRCWSGCFLCTQAFQSTLEFAFEQSRLKATSYEFTHERPLVGD